MNKLSLLAAASLAKHSDDAAIEYEGRWYSWNDVSALANSLATLIEECGGAPNGPIVFIARSQAASIAAFLALIRTGRIIRMVYPFQSPAGIVRDIQMMQPSIVVATQRELKDEVLAGVREQGAAAIVISEMDAQLVMGFEICTAALPADLPTEPQIEILTSGTTGPPKRIDLTYDMLARSVMCTPSLVSASTSSSCTRGSARTAARPRG